MEKGNEKGGGGELGTRKVFGEGVIVRTGLCRTRVTKRGRLTSRVCEVVLCRGLVLEVRGDNSPINLYKHTCTS